VQVKVGCGPLCLCKISTTRLSLIYNIRALSTSNSVTYTDVVFPAVFFFHLLIHCIFLCHFLGFAIILKLDTWMQVSSSRKLKRKKLTCYGFMHARTYVCCFLISFLFLF
jgi:hypothetical protein